MVLNPKEYLTSQGWEGEGKGLQLNSRAKPITVLKKKDTSGIGKDRDHSYPWWDDVFKTVINKISVKKNDDNETKDNQLELRRTETGIISHLPSLSPMIDLEKSNLNLNAINDAKRNEAIQNLYRNFRRGQLIEGTVEEINPSDQNFNQDEQTSKLSSDGNESVQIGSGSTDRDFSAEKEKKRKDRKEKKERKDKEKKKKKDTQRSSEKTNTNDTTNTTETTNPEERKQKKDNNDRKEKKEKREKRKHEEPNQESKLKLIKKVIIDEGLNQIFPLDRSTKNERKMKRKSSKSERSEGDGESSRKKKRKKEE